jgi:hypothetical protein
MGILPILGFVVLLPAGPTAQDAGAKAPGPQGHWQKFDDQATVDLSLRGKHIGLTCEGKGIRACWSGEYTVADSDAHLLYGVFTRLEYRAPDREFAIEQPCPFAFHCTLDGGRLYLGRFVCEGVDATARQGFAGSYKLVPSKGEEWPEK